MGIPFHDHCGLCVPGVTLNGFNVATAEFKFVGRAGVPETMKYHFGEIIFRDEFVKGPVDVICFGRGPLGTGEYKVIISIFIPSNSFSSSIVFCALPAFPLPPWAEIPSAHLSWFSALSGPVQWNCTLASWET